MGHLTSTRQKYIVDGRSGSRHSFRVFLLSYRLYVTVERAPGDSQLRGSHFLVGTNNSKATGTQSRGVELRSQIHGEKCWPNVDKISPCEEACPIHMDVPSYVIALAQARFDDALAIVRETNPFPSICGRVCHHPCEDACSRALVDRPIAIEWLKRFVGEYEQSNGSAPEAPERTKDQSIAVVGSGPAGLTAAHDLAIMGYGVKVYEALPVAGGMLAAGIPEFMLPSDVVEKEIDYIRGLGVDIKTNIRIGTDLTMDELWGQGHKAVLLSTGAWRSPELKIPGADLKGIHPALSFLRDARIADSKIRLKGTVAVIGGGNVALDAARTARRLGADKVFLACLESRDNMPSYEWEIQAAENEGIEVCPSLAPQQFVSRVLGKVSGIDFKKVASASKNDDGRMQWELAKGPDTDVHRDVDSVIVAIGQVPDPSFVEGLNLGGNGTFTVDTDTLATNVPGVFAAGDAVQVPGSIVGAIGEGHTAARSIDFYLSGKDPKEAQPEPLKEVYRFEDEIETPDFLAKKDRWDMPALTPKDAVRSFAESELGYTQQQVIEEAKRCMNCRMCANCLFGRGQVCLETSSRLLATK